MNAKILVITATLGDRETLTKTIDSVKIIGGNKVKHVLVAPKRVVSYIQGKYPDIECLVEPENKKGIYAALNYGFKIYGHDYDYVTFINDDDYWLPEYSTLIDSILNDKSIDFVYGKTKYIDENGKTIGHQTSSSQFYSFLPLIQTGIILLTQQATIIKSNIYFKIGGFDESYKLVADSKFWIELSLYRPKFKYINKECAAYMIQEGQLSSDKATQKSEGMRLKNEYKQYNNIRIKLQAMVEFRLKNSFYYFLRFLGKAK